MGTEANFERGLQLFEMGRFKDAIPYLQKALAVDVDNFEGCAQIYTQISPHCH